MERSGWSLVQGMSIRVIVKRIRAQCSEIIAMSMSSGEEEEEDHRSYAHSLNHSDATKAESNGCEVNSPTGLKPAPRTSEAHRGKTETGTARWMRWLGEETRREGGCRAGRAGRVGID